MDLRHIRPFLADSLMLDGLPRQPLNPEVAAAEKFLNLPVLTAEDVHDIAKAFLAGRVLSRAKDSKLKSLVQSIETTSHNAFGVYARFLRLEPYETHNGIVGRMIWGWKYGQKGGIPQSFLKAFHDQVVTMSLSG